jgi:predicted AlkP superfamily pyrophosphatase or phosphodiesterase
LWTGRSPAEHGVVGYELWLKEYGVVANMLLHSPMSFRGEAGSLARAGFNPESFLPLPVLGAHLAAHGVETYTFQHYSILNSGLTQMLFKDVSKQAYSTAVDLFVNLRRLFESRSADPFYAWVYWGEVDNFSHRYGPDDERTAAEFASFSSAFERLFLSRLSPELRQDTLVILTADHGSVVTAPDPYYQLSNYPSLARRLHILPTGEHRLTYLYIRPGQTEAVREVIDRSWPNQFSVIDPAYAVEAGLFGPGAAHPRLLDRLGDMILAARDNAYLWWGKKEDHLLGRHGGLHPDEMLVPFLAAQLS